MPNKKERISGLTRGGSLLSNSSFALVDSLVFKLNSSCRVPNKSSVYCKERKEGRSFILISNPPYRIADSAGLKGAELPICYLRVDSRYSVKILVRRATNHRPNQMPPLSLLNCTRYSIRCISLRMRPLSGIIDFIPLLVTRK